MTKIQDIKDGDILEIVYLNDYRPVLVIVTGTSIQNEDVFCKTLDHVGKKPIECSFHLGSIKILKRWELKSGEKSNKFYPTSHLKYSRRVSYSENSDTLNLRKVLTQLWKSEDGTEEWRDVE